MSRASLPAPPYMRAHPRWSAAAAGTFSESSIVLANGEFIARCSASDGLPITSHIFSSWLSVEVPAQEGVGGGAHQAGGGSGGGGGGGGGGGRRAAGGGGGSERF